MKLRDFLKLAIAVGVSELAGVLGSVFTVPTISGWYETLQKPALNPPNWVFGPTWTALYFLMGVAAFGVWRSGRRRKAKTALIVFCLQLVLNVAWSAIFFGLKNPFWAFVDIVALWLAIIWTIVMFYRVSKPAALLLLPYILWVSFAAYLNYAIWILN